MYVRSRDKDNYIKKTRINIGLELDQERDEEEFIELKEMDTKSILGLSELEGDDSKIFDYFKEILPSLIVCHSLHETETELMSNEAVVDLVYSKNSLTQLVVKNYIEFVRFTQGKRREEE